MRVSHAHFYKMLFLSACKYGSPEMLIWFVGVFFDYFAAIDQIALRQTFFYGKTLVSKNARINTDWYNQCVLGIFRY